MTEVVEYRDNVVRRKRNDRKGRDATCNAHEYRMTFDLKVLLGCSGASFISLPLPLSIRKSCRIRSTGFYYRSSATTAADDDDEDDVDVQFKPAVELD